MKATVPLDPRDKNYVVVMTEFFFATDEKHEKDGSTHFTAYQFTENRSSFYFRRHLSKPDAFFDAGVMVQTWNDPSVGHFRQTYILQVDLIFLNPFGRKH
jgi:hypothetical protein